MGTKLVKAVAISIAVVLWVGLLLLSSTAKASYVTMDIDSSVRSGTVRCDSVRQCYVRVLHMEQRGATNYCNSVVIKRDGRIVWSKNYWPNTRIR
jgi:hypothetical protein